MDLLLFSLIALVVFLAGVLLIALRLQLQYGDPSASYRLFAVRDRLVNAVVFEGVPRNDPWLQSLYENVNSILIHSNLLAGPDRRALAISVGEYLGTHPDAGKKLNPLPQHEPPEPLKPVVAELKGALTYLIRNHFGIILQRSAQQRVQRRRQKEKARELRDMMPQDGPTPALQ